MDAQIARPNVVNAIEPKGSAKQFRHPKKLFQVSRLSKNRIQQKSPRGSIERARGDPLGRQPGRSPGRKIHPTPGQKHTWLSQHQVVGDKISFQNTVAINEKDIGAGRRPDGLIHGSRFAISAIFLSDVEESRALRPPNAPVPNEIRHRRHFAVFRDDHLIGQDRLTGDRAEDRVQKIGAIID